MIWTNLNLHYLMMPPHKFKLYRPNSFLKEDFWKIFYIYSYVKIKTIITAPPYPRGPWFEQIWIYTTWGCLHTSFSFPGCLVYEKKIFKDFFYIFLCKTWSPSCGPSLPLGTMIWTNLIYTTWGCFHTSFSFSGRMVFEKKIFEKYQQIFNNSQLSPL